MLETKEVQTTEQPDELAEVRGSLPVVLLRSRRSYVGLALGLVALGVCALWTNVREGVLFAALFALLGFLKLDARRNSRRWVMVGVWILACTLFIICVYPACMVGGWQLWGAGLDIIGLNILCVLVVYGLVFVCTARVRLSVSIGFVLLGLLTAANGVVHALRGKELCAFDFLTLTTGLNVAEQYSYTPADYTIHAWILAGSLLFAQFALPKATLPGRTSRQRLGALGVTTALALLLGVCVDRCGIPTESWDKNGTNYNGYYLNFLLGLRDSFIDPPAGYSQEAVEATAPPAADEPPPEEKKRPNVLVIMSESFSDLRVVGADLRTNQPVTPFLDSLTENTIRGYALASVYGAKTANSEFEFLTGHSMAFLPEGSVPYQQYVQGEMFTLAWLMREYGYTSKSTHPYYADGWSRNRIYPDLGFQESTFHEAYPKETWVRRYISDQEMYDFMLGQLETEDPLFLFGITMQNHGGYTYEGDNYSQTIELEGYSKEYPLAEQYLSLIHETDRATEDFLTRLETYPEDTIVLFFGDHYPKIESEFYEELYGGPFEELNDKMLKFTVPFFIWANFDIEEETVERSSLNYLSRRLLEAAGLPLDPYHSFLADMEAAVPAMNSQGYYSLSQQTYLPYEAAEGEEAQWLSRYESLQYNALFDLENRSWIFYEQYLPSQQKPNWEAIDKGGVSP